MATRQRRSRATYIGPRLRRLRRELGMTQVQMAEDLEVSPSYIALMERNQRPVTAEILLRLSVAYSVDVAEFAGEDTNTVSDRLSGVLRDPIFNDIEFAPNDVQDIASGYPALADALLRLHTAYRENETALADRSHQPPSGPDPVAEARRFLSARKNFFPVIDGQAERLAASAKASGTLGAYFEETQQLRIRSLPRDVMAGAVRRLDHHRRELVLDETLDAAGRTFQIALQLVYLELGGAVEAALAEGSFQSENGRRLAKRALANYAASAIIMPYTEFQSAAETMRYDLEALCRRFGSSFEQVAHRLTTLQKPGQEGVPFFFIRVDPAGNVSKRLDGAGFPFARHGGSCPLWSVHHAFKTPRRIIPEWVELPGGDRFFSISRTVTAGGGAFDAPRVERAIALACAEEHASRLVYADDPGLSASAPTPIGVSCRLCHRAGCIARAEPPIGRPVADDTYRRPGTPFAFTDE
ncbi:helix-turn-helix domain-containing protein [Parvularcula lutaonensis]|uniref:Short-chain fatty acyl-CoA regulator family protein n=1 Tax=Parvularcula lutaonensis TaxID=491923 RepID=A0ABV7MDA6_9PROT|nr:XRE family transcriptional regulator [Parvularcula lutaonensis]GGY48875.1 XRE family transcriptional regulator [Parvularcula lutaonensis]